MAHSHRGVFLFFRTAPRVHIIIHTRVTVFYTYAPLQLLGIIFNWMLYGVLLVQLCEFALTPSCNSICVAHPVLEMYTSITSQGIGNSSSC